MSRITLRIEPNPAKADLDELRQRLHASNVRFMGEYAHEPFLITACDEHGSPVAGISGTSVLNALMIDVLFTDEARRGQGLASQLLAAAEALGRERGCDQAQLGTFSFQALPFYQRHGYATVGEVPNFPPGFTQYFLLKSLRV